MNLQHSNATIRDNIEILSSHSRGKQALADLKTFLNANQAGLDVCSGNAVLDLVAEFFVNHRRDFIK